jgi:tetratricopeptide (TPR) repeat protein
MTSSGILKELFRRRVPQILGVYLAAGWAVLEFTDFLVNRFVLSPHLIDFSMLAWVLLVPSVLMLAWYHGAPGRDKWTKFEKLGIPANLVVAAALLGAVFGGRDLGAATESVTVEDETGETVERTVPKGEFRKNIASFYFDNVSGDTALDWLQYGIPLTLQSDLAQDIFIGVRTAGDTRTRLREEGLADGLGVPLPLKRQIASQLHVAHFIAGDVTREAGRLAVTTRLYETRRGKLIQERTFSGDDLFALTDEMSVQLRRDLGIPTQVIEEGRDLPVSELLTESIPAYRSYVEAARASIMAEDLDVVVTHLEQAVAHDPQFADAHFMRFGLYFNLNRMDEARAAAQAGMQFIYKLPERSQAHLLLSQFRFARGEVARAVSALERVLELDPSRVDVLLDIGGMHEEAGEFDAALNNYERYAAASPNDPGAFIRLGRLHRTRGDHVAAKSQYERALIVDPDNVVAMTSIADIDRDLGSFESALRGYDEALAAAVTAEQRAGIYAAYEFYHGVRGQPNRAIDYMHRRFAEMEGYAGPFNTLQQKLQNLHTYVAAGQADVAKDTLASIAARLSPPNDVLLALGQLNLYLALEDADSVEAAIEGLDRFIEAWGLEYARPMAIRAQGRVLEIRGDCVEAIVSYRRTLELWPTSVEVALVDIGRCYRKLQRFDEAEDHLTRLLELRPYNPLAHYELGLVYADSGDREKALEHLRTALEVWSDADTVYKPAREAREKLAELSSTSL